MFKHGFPPEWSTFKKLIWLVGSGIAGAASGIWKTVTGTLIHLTDALASPMQKCEVSLEPIQDLHGQDAPYPAGGGKNLLNPETLADNMTLDGVTGLPTVSSNRIATTTPIDVSTLSSVAISWTASMSNVVALYSTFANGTLVRRVVGISSGSSIDVSDADQLYVSLYSNIAITVADVSKFQIESGTTATAYSPYSNICPITGWTGCEANRTGSNQFDKSTAVVGEGLTASGGTVPSQTSTRSDYIKVIPNTRYRKIFDVADGVERLVQCFDAEKNFIGYLLYRDVRADVEFTTPANCFFVRIAFPQSQIDNVRLIFASSGQSTDYEPYSGTTLSVTFPETVYGGSHEFVEGLLKIPKKCFIFDGTEEWYRWQACDGGSWFVLYFKDSDHAASIDYRKNISSHFKSINSNSITTSSPTFEFGVSKTWLACSAPYNTADEFKAYLAAQYNANTPVQIFYELFTPTEISLTPQPISTLKGVNNVWSNSNGATTVIYKAQAE